MRDLPPTPGSVIKLRLLYLGDERNLARLRFDLTQEAEERFLLDHAATVEAAAERFKSAAFDLLLFDEGSEPLAVENLLERLPLVSSVGVVFLCTEEYPARQREELRMVPSGGEARPVSPSDIRYVARSQIGAFCRQRQREKTEQMCRTLWRAVEQASEAIVITDRNGTMEYVNPAFETLTGYLHAEAVGQNLRILKSDQQSFEVFQDLWKTILSGNVFRGVLVSCKKNGETYVVEKTVTPLRDGEGNIVRFISSDRDITEQRRLEAQLQQAQKMDAIGHLAGGVAHDFNNLLLVIGAYAELALDAMDSQNPLRHNLQEITHATRSAADLTRQLLAFSRKQVQSLQVLDLNRVILGIYRMLPRLVGEDIELAFVPAPDIGRVRADPVQVEQIIMNLAANARDAMPLGGRLTFETAHVRVDEAYVSKKPSVPRGDYIVLSVTDSGEGISSEHIAHIFEPFYSTKEQGQGTGLGLATVYGIVKQSGGFVWVYSEPGQGTTFKIYLPQAQGKVQEPPSDTSDLKSPTGDEVLLLVEDDEVVRNAENEFLSQSGYRIIEAANGMEAIRRAKEFDGAIQLMVTDVVMPHMGGAKLASKLAQLRPDMRIIFVSGYAESTVLRHGAIDVTTRFLQKPFSLKSLARKIRSVLDAAPSTSETESALV